jgi:hypothetical protein
VKPDAERESPRFRRPGPAWCTETAVRLLRIACGETGASPRLLSGDECQLLLQAAATLDAYGQRIAAARKPAPPGASA